MRMLDKARELRRRRRRQAILAIGNNVDATKSALGFGTTYTFIYLTLIGMRMGRLKCIHTRHLLTPHHINVMRI